MDAVQQQYMRELHETCYAFTACKERNEVLPSKDIDPFLVSGNSLLTRASDSPTLGSGTAILPSVSVAPESVEPSQVIGNSRLTRASDVPAKGSGTDVLPGGSVASALGSGTRVFPSVVVPTGLIFQMVPRQNQSTITEIYLLGFQGLHEWRILLFLAILVIYVVTIAGNLLIIVLVSAAHHLQSPMYIFLSHLSMSDILLTSSISPNMLDVILKEGAIISLVGCFSQFYMLGVSSVTECLLLTVMSYDRYLAICKPLHYTSIMNFTFCRHLVLCSWILGSFMTLIVIIILLNTLHFCGPNIIDHFFCDYAPLLHLSCSDTRITQILSGLIAALETIIQTVFIISTYCSIFFTILRISSSTGRQKAFTTCSSHLAVVCTYYGTLIAIYIAPSGGHLFNMNKILSLLYTVVTPLLNPIIYSLKNQEIRKAFKMHLNRF
ncbi:olfactory receptor 11A1-like [Rhinophrynus dorsalis]